MEVKLLVDGGEMKPGPAISQKMGPLGLNLGKIISDVNKATQEFKGMKVPVILDINTKTKNFTVKALTPPTAELLKREIGIEKGTPEPNKIKVGNISIEQVIKIAKIKQEDMIVNGLKAAVNSVLGSCFSIGILVEGKDAREVIQEIAQGNYKELILKGVDKASQEKLDNLKKDFEKVQKSQEAYIKELEAKKEAKATPAAAGTGEAAAPTSAGTPAAATSAPVATTPAKRREKKK
jgi:large subunit ribosomal protein L11